MERLEREGERRKEIWTSTNSGTIELLIQLPAEHSTFLALSVHWKTASPGCHRVLIDSRLPPFTLPRSFLPPILLFWQWTANSLLQHLPHALSEYLRSLKRGIPAGILNSKHGGELVLRSINLYPEESHAGLDVEHAVLVVVPAKVTPQHSTTELRRQGPLIEDQI